MEFRHLRCFTVLAEELHFGRAAQRLAMTQPPLSLNIQQLEASVGARLFERNSRGVSLTAAGEAFLPKAIALLEQAAQAAREARDVGQGLAGQLQIGFAGTVLYRGLPQMLRDFAAGAPAFAAGVARAQFGRATGRSGARPAGPGLCAHHARARRVLSDTGVEPAVCGLFAGEPCQGESQVACRWKACATIPSPS